MGAVQIMTRSHLDNDRKSDLRRYDTGHTKSTPGSRNWQSIRVLLPSPGYSCILTHVGRLDRRRPWNTSVTRDLLVKSVIRR